MSYLGHSQLLPILHHVLSSPDYEKIIDLQIKYIKPFQENISSNGITDKDLNNANDFKCLHKQDTNNLLVTRTLNKLVALNIAICMTVINQIPLLLIQKIYLNYRSI